MYKWYESAIYAYLKAITNKTCENVLKYMK